MIWNKRADYNAAFHGFDLARVAAMTEADVRALVESPLGVVHIGLGRSVALNYRLSTLYQIH